MEDGIKHDNQSRATGDTKTNRAHEARGSVRNVNEVATSGNIENAVAVSGLLAQLVRELGEHDKKMMARSGFDLKQRQKLYSILKKFNEAHSLIQKREGLNQR